jgi:hypothetical protein
MIAKETDGPGRGGPKDPTSPGWPRENDLAMRLRVRDNRVNCPQRGAVDVERCCACSWCEGVDAGAVQCSHRTFRFGADLDLLRLGIVPTTRRTGQTF